MKILLQFVGITVLSAIIIFLIQPFDLHPVYTPLTIETHTGDQVFEVELALTGSEQERGLMYRTQLPANRGMLFVFSQPHVITMWMKNTRIPLDMVFIGKEGKIVSIHENAEPESEDIISSVVPAGAVLEIPGGTVAQQGIAVGDTIRHEHLP